MQKWWTCPKCRDHKMIDVNCKFVRCSGCGRNFDENDKEVYLCVSLDDINSQSTEYDLR